MVEASLRSRALKSCLPLVLGATLACGFAAQSGAAQTAAVPLPKLSRPSAKLAEDAPLLTWVEAGKQPKVVLLCIHGLGLHKGSYEAFGKEMSKNGISVVAIDMRGFGAWLESGKHTKTDFDGSLADIEFRLKKIHQEYPGVPVVIVGESMGGAIALRATALYPELISGLISSVPSGDRYNELGQGFKIGMHVLLGGGMNRPMNIGDTIVKQATKKDDLRETWSQDPEGKMKLTPAELLRFQNFMKENFDAAKMITSAPVLFIQGVSDKLVRPAGTWQLYDSLSTPNRQLVLSKHGEHLIFEDAQFSSDDLLFVRTWINKNIVALDPTAVASRSQQPSVAQSIIATDGDAAYSNSASSAAAAAATARGNGAGRSSAPPVVAETDTSKTTKRVGSAPTAQAGSGAATVAKAPLADNNSGRLTKPLQTSRTVGTVASTGDSDGLNYWIELFRAGKSYRCNNKTQFQSGDSIRFHVIPQNDGYGYVLMKESSTGKSSVLFPTKQTGTNNYLTHGKDYVLPSKTWLEFDNHPGVERLTLVFSHSKLDDPTRTQRYLTAYVSPSEAGSKDLVPTRMQLSWDDPTPVIIPDDFAGVGSGSLVQLRSNSHSGVLSIDVALEHR